MNVFVHELRRNVLLTAVWTFTIICVSGIILAFYPIIQSDFLTYMDVMNKFPQAVRSAMGMYTDLFSSPIGYYTFALTMSLFFTGIHALLLGVGIVSKETRDKTADFLMTKPVSRASILTSKVLASVVLLFSASLSYSVVILIILTMLADGNSFLSKFILLCIGMFYLQIVLYFIGLLVSVLAKKIRSVLPVSLGLAFFFYALSAFAVTSESDKLRYFTPYEYVKPRYIVTNESFEISYIVCGLVVLIACVIISYVVYMRKDIHSV